MPFTPREAVGIPAGTATGPYILLFPNGNVDSELQSVALTGPGGEVVPVKVVRPDAPAPSAPAGWPRRNSVSSGPYVIPSHH